MGEQPELPLGACQKGSVLGSLSRKHVVSMQVQVQGGLAWMHWVPGPHWELRWGMWGSTALWGWVGI